VVSLLPLAWWAGASEPRPPADALARERYEMVSAPSGLPPEIQSALARHLGQERLHMAAPGEPFTSGDLVVDKSLPSRRLIAAAVGKTYAVVHYEQGGFARTRRVVVVERAPSGPSEVVWSGRVPRTYEPPEFERAIHSRSLWKKAVSR